MILIVSCICISLVSIVIYIYNLHNKTQNENKQNSDIRTFLLADSIEEEYHYNQDLI
jgi:flagellar basal body-associated protein FliL